VQEYNLILSLGNTCQTAYQIERKGLRKCAGPLDWFISPLDGTIKLLENRFTNFMQKENLKIIDVYENRKFVVKDTLYNIISYHDFPCSNEYCIKVNDYEFFKTRLMDKINRFYTQLETLNSILFIINGASTGIDEYIRLSKIIAVARKKLSFHVLICGYSISDKMHLKQIENISFYKFRKIKRFSDPSDRWKGNDEEWDNCLNGIKICS
jgi:hypothetical protein